MSATVVVRKPRHDNCDSPLGRGTSAVVGLNPTSPVNAAGVRIEPPPSDPVPNGTMPAATADEVPPLLPPGVRAGSQGFRVTPKLSLYVAECSPNSGTLVLPRGIAPAARSRAIIGSSAAADGAPAKALLPWAVGIPATSEISLTANGTPARGPQTFPRATCA